MSNWLNAKETKEQLGYGVGGLFELERSVKKELDCAKGDDDKILDPNSYNFHLYPKDKEKMEEIANEVEKVRNEVIKQLKEQGACVDRNEFEELHKGDDTIYVSAEISKNEVAKNRGRGSNGGKDFNNLYRYIAAKKNDTLYELNFMRFFIDKENNVNCILKAIQFDRCMDERSDSGVNYDVETKKCRICYPTSYRSQKISLNKIIDDNKGKSFCYNPDVSFFDKPEDIAKAFIEFIDECDKEKSYIVHSSVLSPACSYYLKLDRTAHRLDVYERDGGELRKFYPLRKDFDASDYVLFTLKKSVPCIFGGEGKARTPEGIFRIEYTSKFHEEYISSYHPKHDKVKFFGYLKVFEDYFIHSDMYLTDAEEGTFTDKEPISLQDGSTSGCIRVSQEELDWLVKNIPVGSMIET